MSKEIQVEIKKIAIDRVTLADAAYAQIAEGVLSQDLRPGTRLLMDELAEALGISRTPVREALHRLEMERVIEPYGRRGYVVRALSDVELDKQYDGRAAIEPYALAEVARRGGSAAAFLRRAFEELIELPQTTAMEVFQVNMALHRATVEALDNEFLVRMFDVNWQTGIGVRAWADILEKGQAGSFADSHRPLVEAAESGDPELARRVVQEHIFAGRGLHLVQGPPSAS